MNIAIIGTGYVGLPTGVGFAELGNNVTCIDIDENKIKSLKEGNITLYEDGLLELFVKNTKNGNLNFTSSLEDGVKNAEIVIIAVGTPPHPVTKEADMKYIHAAAKDLAKYLNNYKVVAIKSTVPVGTGDEVENIIRQENPNADFDMVSLPEFLREGFAVYDFFNPDRIVVGTNSIKAREVISRLYADFKDKTNILYTNRRSSETIKYASNSFLAMKIHFINEMADFCEQSGADILEVAKGMGLDTRIGNRFLNPGPGYGGSCFPKDTLAMAYMGRQYNIDLSLINAAIKGNDDRKDKIANKIKLEVKDIKNANIAILGLAFKNGTDDCRESPAIDIVNKLLSDNLNIKAYDPKAMDLAKVLLGDKIKYSDNMYDCIKDADLLVILTEWNEFKELDLEQASKLMRNKNILDFRNLLDKDKVLKSGFKYKGVGR